MSWWSDTWNDITGQTARDNQNAGKDLMNQSAKSLGKIGSTEQDVLDYERGQEKNADTAFNASVGGSAADYTQRAQEAADKLASEQAARTTETASQEAIKAGRAAGLNPGQAALTAGQNIGEVANKAYTQGQTTGLQTYGQGTQAIQQQGAAKGGLGQQAAGVAVGAQKAKSDIGSTRFGAGNQQNANWWGGLGQAAGAVASLI